MSDAEDVFRIPVQVMQTSSSFVVVKLRADSLKEAQARAVKDVEQLCRTGELDDVIGPSFDWEHDEYECGGVTGVQGDIESYGVDIDKADEPTAAERRIDVAQTSLPLQGD